MRCIACGSELTMEPDLQEARCQGCGIRYPLDALKDMHETQVKNMQSAPPSDMKTKPLSLQPMAAQEKAGSTTNSSEMRGPQSCETYPTLDAWDTSYGLSFLGCVLAALLCSLPYNGFAGWAITIAYGIATAIYAIAIYPSFFKSKPFLTSPSAISFLNCLFGGCVFGSLWNYNLTKRKRGISYIVCIGIMTLSVVLLIFALLTSGTAAFDDSNTLEQAESNTESIENPLERIRVPNLESKSFSNLIQELRARGTYNPTTWCSDKYRDLEEALSDGAECLIDMGLSEKEAATVIDRMANAKPEINTHDYRDDYRNRMDRIRRSSLEFAQTVERGGYVSQCGTFPLNSVITKETRMAEFDCYPARYSITFHSDRTTEYDPNDLSQMINEETKYSFTIQQIS